MIKYISFITLFFLITGCQNDEKNILTLNVEIKGLTKGLLLLEKIRDGKILVVDSVEVRKKGTYSMQDTLFSPEVYYLRLKENSDGTIPFFAESGKLELHGKLDKFSTSYNLKGSKNHTLWEEYKKMIAHFNDEKLSLIKDDLEAKKSKNTQLIDSVSDKYNKHLKRRYLYTTNFAVKHADCEIAPYLALTELENANLFLLDTIAKSMNEKVKKSYYGNIFLEHLKEKKTSNNMESVQTN